jgi:hypothetical protein
MMELTGGVHLSVGEGEVAGTSSGEAGVGRGRKLAWPGSVPLGLLSLFFVLFIFLFLLSLFFPIFCKNASNQIKPLSEIF